MIARIFMWTLLACEMARPFAAQAAPHPDAVEQERAVAPASMVEIPAGVYRPFFKTTAPGGKSALQVAAPIQVRPFKMDRSPVTRGDYLAFVRLHPQWRKSQVKALFAEPTYLADWLDDLDPGSSRLREPVTRVSWFAARAYCAARNARLPTVAEWERVAGAGAGEESIGEGGRDAGAPFRFAMGRAAADVRSLPLEFPGLWEWNADFNSALAASGSESAAGRSSLFCGDGFRATDARNYGAFLRHSLRSSLKGNYALKNLGFRCAVGE